MKEAIAALAASILPTFMVLIGILLNRNDINRLDSRITSLESMLRAEINGIRGKFQGLRGEFQGLCSEFNSLRAQMHSDMMMLMSTNGDFEKRISALEESSKAK
jgi:hypothetical protein